MRKAFRTAEERAPRYSAKKGGDTLWPRKGGGISSWYTGFVDFLGRKRIGGGKRKRPLVSVWKKKGEFSERRRPKGFWVPFAEKEKGGKKIGKVFE